MMLNFSKSIYVTQLLCGIAFIITEIAIFPLAQVTVLPGEITVLGGMSYLMIWRILLVVSGVVFICIGSMGITISSKRFGLGKPLTIKDLPVGKYFIAGIWKDYRLVKIYQANHAGQFDVRLLEVDRTDVYSPAMKIEITGHDINELEDLDPTRFFKEGKLIIKKLN